MALAEVDEMGDDDRTQALLSPLPLPLRPADDARLADGRPALTARQAEVLRFISDFVTEHGFGPTLREIGKGLAIRSTNGVNDHLRALERKGYLTRDCGTLRSRTIRVVESASASALLLELDADARSLVRQILGVIHGAVRRETEGLFPALKDGVSAPEIR